MKGCVYSALVAALVCAAPALVHAEGNDEAEITAMAKEHYKQGLDAYKNGKYPEAIKELKKAYLLKRLPALLLNIGATYRKMGDIENSVYYYKKYLAEAPEARDRGEVEKTLAELAREKPGAGATPPSEAAGEAAAPATGSEWRHTPVDAAPPDQPLDVRVVMPVSKGVKVYVYYRGAGESEFNQVQMKRHGSEKVGRIPAAAMSGKSMQYYVEGKDDKGNVVKSFGSPSDPNIVRIDASAAPQLVKGVGGGDEKSAGTASARNDLDDEQAPVTGEIVDRPGRHHRATSSSSSRGESRASRFGTAFWIGSALAVAGVAGVAVGSYGLFQAKSYADVLSTDSNFRDPQTGQPYKFSDPSASPYDDKTVEARGKFWNGLGIGMTVAGGVALLGGVTLIALDQTVFKNKAEKPKRSAWLAPAIGPSMAGVAGGAAF